MAARGGRGDRNGGRSGGPKPREEQISRALSKLLRHQAEKEGLKLGPGGYINLQDVLNNRMLRSLKITLAEIHAIVESNEKQRFKLIPIGEAADLEGAEDPFSASEVNASSADASQWLIRANQGHSINVDEDGLLEPITLESEVPSTVVHGTTAKAWPLIMSTGGLKKMTRNHVHFAPGLPSGFKSRTEALSNGDEMRKEPAISGMRNSSNILIFIDVRQALESGIKFWRSANGVILSNGNNNGLIPTQYFQRVEDRKIGKLIMKDGQILPQGD